MKPAIGTPFKRGDIVRATCEGRTVEAEIAIASENGRSLAITFEAILAGHVGMMPILQHDDGGFRSLVGGVPVTLEKP